MIEVKRSYLARLWGFGGVFNHSKTPGISPLDVFPSAVRTVVVTIVIARSERRTGLHLIFGSVVLSALNSPVFRDRGTRLVLLSHFRPPCPCDESCTHCRVCDHAPICETGASSSLQKLPCLALVGRPQYGLAMHPQPTDWTAIGVIVTGRGVFVAVVGLIITIGIYASQSANARRAASDKDRRRLVSAIIDRVVAANRTHARWPLGNAFVPPEFELSLSLPSLLVALPRGEEAVAYWIARQIQIVQLESNARKALQQTNAISFRLASWYRGDVLLQWFQDEAAHDRWDPTYKVPRLTHLRKQLWVSWRIGKLTVAAAAIVLTSRSTWIKITR